VIEAEEHRRATAGRHRTSSRRHIRELLVFEKVTASNNLDAVGPI
jgi:hypothetical protein